MFKMDIYFGGGGGDTIQPTASSVQNREHQQGRSLGESDKCSLCMWQCLWNIQVDRGRRSELGAQGRGLDIIVYVWYLKVHKISQGEHIQQEKQWAENGPSRNANN